MEVQEKFRELATVRKLKFERIVPETSFLCVAEVVGTLYKVVVKTSEYFPSEDHSDEPMVIYFESDSVLDSSNPAFDFLSQKTKLIHRVIRPKKMYGVLSEGLVMPLSIVEYYGVDVANLVVGQNVTETLRVTKYVPVEEVPSYNPGTGAYSFSEGVPKTESFNLYSSQNTFQQLQEQKVFVCISKKLDGQSMTVTKDEVCSRENAYRPVQTDSNGRFIFPKAAFPLNEIENKLQLLQKLRDYYTETGNDIAIQGEAIGLGINKNPHQLRTRQFIVYLIFDRNQKRYLTTKETLPLLERFQLEMVPILYDHVPLTQFSAEQLVTLAEDTMYQLFDDGVYKSAMDISPAGNVTNGEGIVVRVDEEHFMNPLKFISIKVKRKTYKHTKAIPAKLPSAT